MPQQLTEGFQKAEDKLAAAAAHSAEVLKTMESKGEERYAAAREKIRDRWMAAKADMDNLRHSAMDYSQSAAKTVDTFARDRPWTTAGIAAGVGLLLGWLIARD